jgi:MtN3 and saliva related transmembrane protein
MTMTARTIEFIGFVAASLTTAAFVPQLARVLRLRSARDISLGTFLMFSLGVFLWLVYGIYAHSKPVIASNAVTLVLSVSILLLKLKYDRPEAKDRT